MKRPLIFALVGIFALGCRVERAVHVDDSSKAAPGKPESAPESDASTHADVDLLQCVRIPRGSLNGEQIADICMDITETTVEEFRHCVEVGRCLAPSESCLGSLYYKADRQRYPVNCVTHEQAAEYCAWQHKRLPTAAEWQWAAQGGDAARPFPWGEAMPNCEYANLYFGGTNPPSALGECGRDWAPVASFPRGESMHGVFDLQGNVSEWTSDGDGSGAVVKGVAANVDFSHEELEPSYEGWANASYPSGDIGFRCVRDLPK